MVVVIIDESGLISLLETRDLFVHVLSKVRYVVIFISCRRSCS